MAGHHSSDSISKTAPPSAAVDAISAAHPCSVRHVRLEAADVTVTAPHGGKIVNSVSLLVDAGERLAIVGPNGAGKSTLLRVLSGQRKPDRGRILVGGGNLNRISSYERARLMAVVGQSDAPDLRLTVAEYAGLGRIPHGGRVSAAHHKAVIAEALARVGLNAMANRPLATLSGGERQRASIARVIAQEVSILLLDEPTNHLDLRARSEILDIVRKLGITVVAVLHDLALVNTFADRIAVIRGGELAAYGPVNATLTPAIVRDVFAMDCFSFSRPDTGQPLLVFDRPAA